MCNKFYTPSHERKIFRDNILQELQITGLSSRWSRAAFLNHYLFWLSSTIIWQIMPSNVALAYFGLTLDVLERIITSRDYAGNLLLAMGILGKDRLISHLQISVQFNCQNGKVFIATLPTSPAWEPLYLETNSYNVQTLRGFEPGTLFLSDHRHWPQVGHTFIPRLGFLVIRSEILSITLIWFCWLRSDHDHIEGTRGMAIGDSLLSSNLSGMPGNKVSSWSRVEERCLVQWW